MFRFLLLSSVRFSMLNLRRATMYISFRGEVISLCVLEF